MRLRTPAAVCNHQHNINTVHLLLLALVDTQPWPRPCGICRACYCSSTRAPSKYALHYGANDSGAFYMMAGRRIQGPCVAFSAAQLPAVSDRGAGSWPTPDPVRSHLPAASHPRHHLSTQHHRRRRFHCPRRRVAAGFGHGPHCQPRGSRACVLCLCCVSFPMTCPSAP